MAEQTPLHDVTSQAGATFVEEAGWQVPRDFGDPAAEYTLAREEAAVFDVSHRGKVSLAGPDAGRFLHNLCTNDIVGLAAGSGCEAFLTSTQAKIVASALVYRVAEPDGADTFWLDLDPGVAAKVVTHLDRYLISEQVELADRTREWAQVHLAGPRAADVLQQIGGGEVADLQPLHQLSLSLAEGVLCTIRRHDPLGLPGFDVLCQSKDALALWTALTAAGAAVAGSGTYDILRVEAGTPIYGRDIDDTNLPQETGRTEHAVSFTKGCYIGQETIARIRTYGHVNRSLVGLKIAGDELAPPGSLVHRDGKEVGRVTSSVLSPRFSGALALAYLRRGHESPGVAVEVERPGEPRSAEVVALPFGR